MSSWHIFGSSAQHCFLLPSLIHLLALHTDEATVTFPQGLRFQSDRVGGLQRRGHAVPSAVSSEHTNPPPTHPTPLIPPSPRMHQVSWSRLLAKIRNSPDTSCICSACAAMWHGSDDTAALARCSQSACGDCKQPTTTCCSSEYCMKELLKKYTIFHYTLF